MTTIQIYITAIFVSVLAICVAASAEVADTIQSPPMTSQNGTYVANGGFYIYVPISAEPFWRVVSWISDSGLLFEFLFCSLIFGIVGGFRKSRQAKYAASALQQSNSRGQSDASARAQNVASRNTPPSSIASSSPRQGQGQICGSGRTNSRNNNHQNHHGNNNHHHPPLPPGAGQQRPASAKPALSTAATSPTASTSNSTPPVSGRSDPTANFNNKLEQIAEVASDYEKQQYYRYQNSHGNYHNNHHNNLKSSGSFHMVRGGNHGNPGGGARLVSPVVRVNQVITNLSCPFKILEYVVAQAEETKLSAINVATTIHRVAKTCRGANVKVDDVRKHPRFQVATRMVLNMLESNAFKAQELSNVLWALATLRHRNPELLRTISHRIVHRLESFNGQEVTNVVWSMATLAYPDEEVFGKVKARVMELMPTLLPMEIGNITWAYATTGNLTGEMSEAIAQCTVKTISLFQPHALAITTWAFTTAKFEHRNFLAAVARRVQQYRLKDMNTQDISNFSWGFATFFRPSHPDEFREVFATLGDGVLTHVHEFLLPQSISNTLWAFATVGYRHKGIEKLGRLAETIVSCFNAQGVVNTMWAMKVLGYLSPQGFESFLVTVPRKFRFVSPATFSYFLHTLAFFDYSDASRLQSLFNSVEFYAPTATPEMCARIAWSLAVLRCPLQAAFGVLGDRILEILQSGSPAEVFGEEDAKRIVWAFTVSSNAHPVVDAILEVHNVGNMAHKASNDFVPSVRQLGA